MNKLDYDKLSKENRYGILVFSIEVFFDLGILKDYVIPLALRREPIFFTGLEYELFGLSPYFEKVKDIISSKDAPRYKGLISHDGNIKFKKL